MRIKNGDVFNLYQDGQETKRCMAVSIEVGGIVPCIDLRASEYDKHTKSGNYLTIFADVESEIGGVENVLFNVFEGGE